MRPVPVSVRDAVPLAAGVGRAVRPIGAGRLWGVVLLSTAVARPASVLPVPLLLSGVTGESAARREATEEEWRGRFPPSLSLSLLLRFVTGYIAEGRQTLPPPPAVFGCAQLTAVGDSTSLSRKLMAEGVLPTFRC